MRRIARTAGNDQNAQMGALQAVAEAAGALPRETSSLVDEALVHAQHGATMITSMLDYSKMRAGKLKLTSVAFELQELLDSSMCAPRACLRGRGPPRHMPPRAVARRWLAARHRPSFGRVAL